METSSEFVKIYFEEVFQIVKKLDLEKINLLAENIHQIREKMVEYSFWVLVEVLQIPVLMILENYVIFNVNQLTMFQNYRLEQMMKDGKQFLKDWLNTSKLKSNDLI